MIIILIVIGIITMYKMCITCGLTSRKGRLAAKHYQQKRNKMKKEKNFFINGRENEVLLKDWETSDVMYSY